MRNNKCCSYICKKNRIWLSDKIKSIRNKSILVILTNIILAFSLSGQISPSLKDIAKQPELPYEATTFEQDDLIDIINSRYQYDGFADEDLSHVTFCEACDWLMKDYTAPFELRCWAIRRKLERYSNSPGESVRNGYAWLHEQEEQDSNPIEIRYMIVRSVARSGYLQGLPYYEDIRAIFDDFFLHHSPDNMYAAEAHLDYAHLLDRFSIMNVEYYKKSIEQLGEAVIIMEWLLQNKEYSKEERNALETKIDKYKQEYEKRLLEGIPAESYWDEGEYREMDRVKTKKLEAYIQEQGLNPDEFDDDKSIIHDVINSISSKQQ